MNVLDLFSGIGGFSLGLGWAGMETVAFCEIDPYCRAVLKKHWPDMPIFEDMRDVTGEALRGLRPIDLVCGGFPCQPVSQAGKRRGKGDDRWLWPEMLRVVSELRPTWVIGENVAGLVTMGLDDCLSDLEGEGYACQAFVIPACAVGAPHRRDRVWIVAHAAQGNGARKLQKPRRESKTSTGRVSAGGRSSGQDVAHAEKYGRGQRNAKLGGTCEGVPAGQAGRGPADGGRIPHPNGQPPHWSAIPRQEHCEWPAEPDVGRVAHGIPRRVDRLRALGNSVVPQVVYEIGRAIMEAESVSSQPGEVLE